MKKISPFYYWALIILLTVIALQINAQTKSILDEAVPENFYVIPAGFATWDAIENDDFQFYKIWLNSTFIADVDTNFFQYNEEELISGETYIAEVQALYNSGVSDKVNFEFVYLPCDSFPNHTMVDAYNLEGFDEVLITWSDYPQPELIEINQGYGEGVNGQYQSFNYGYGVVFNLAGYPDAVIHSANFYHKSWGNLGTWDYKIHIIDWVNKQTIAIIGPYQTTDNDTWENDIELGDIGVEGITEIGIFMEPMGNVSDDAYPCIAGDNFDDPQGSTIVNLSNLQDYSSSTIGNFLLSIDIYTYNGKNRETIRLGTNIYIDDSIIAFVPEPDTFYIIEEAPQYGFWDLCITSVYSNDEGNHNWNSCYGDLCINDIGIPWPCLAPENLEADYNYNNGVFTVHLYWDAPQNNPQEILGYNIIRDGSVVYDTLIQNTSYVDNISYGYYCYHVVSVYSECISEESNETCIFPWAVNNIDTKVSVFPNPTKDNIRVNSKSTISGIKIYNRLGVLCKSIDQIHTLEYMLDVSNLETGVYILEIGTKTDTQKTKIIIQ
ncbi:MAG: hypothetical protein DRI86_10810 [Bacteroidetes bacterium]|nr:MAG: hypothetical protein DRI86_10810 [Bacteroidota bacterium]